MGARYPYYILADSKDGQIKEAEIQGKVPSENPTHGNIRHGFVYERVPHITLKSIVNNSEIDVVWDEYQTRLEVLREQLNSALNTKWEEWEIPRETNEEWCAEAKELHSAWWKVRLARQKAIDASIAAKADYEYLYDKPYEDKRKVRVAGPFTVESLSPHRILAVDENENLIETSGQSETDARDAQDFVQIILDNLKVSGVQQPTKKTRSFSPRLLLGPAITFALKGVSRKLTAAKSVPAFSSGPSSALSRVKTSWQQRARPATLHSMY